MESLTIFQCFGSLNDFLPSSRKNKPFNYLFKGKPSIKDTIESVGVPHTEVDQIVVNGTNVDFSYAITNSDQVEIYPLDSITNRTTKSLIPSIIGPIQFIVDSNAGKLAKALRMLGIDAHDVTGMNAEDVAKLAEKDKRIVLTRNKALLKHKKISQGYWLRSQMVNQQLQEVIRRFDLHRNIRPFTRCIVCNGIIETVNKEKVWEDLPQQTRQYFNEYYQCQSCKKVYWKGSHYGNMIAMINDAIVK